MIYPHRPAIPREVWIRFFASAEREIGILAYSFSFLAEDREIVCLPIDKACSGVVVRIALREPEGSHTAEWGDGEGIGGAVPARRFVTPLRSTNR